MEAMGLSTPDEHQKVVRTRWDWDRFQAHNDIWKDTVRELMKARTSGQVGGAKWYYMDIWDQSMQRPDAHTENLVDPKHDHIDCLHCEYFF